MGLPCEISSLLGGLSSTYRIRQSLRFNSADSPYLTRTFATPTSSSRWTMSMWVKRSSLGVLQGLFGKTNSATANFYLAFDANNNITWGFTNSAFLTTTAVYRDTTAWYHIVAAWDSANTVVQNRARLWVNGVEITSFSLDQRSSISTAADAWNTTSTAFLHGIGAISQNVSAVTNFLNGYMAEVNFIDGQALGPSSFGQFDLTTGVWVPKRYVGTYGNNGFYFNFSDNSAATAAALGKDTSGRGNNWTPNNLSVTAGTGNDVLADSPTNNFAVLNPLVTLPGSGASSYVQGNLQFTVTSGEGSGEVTAITNMPLPTTGKWYWETTVTTVATLAASRTQIGIMGNSTLTRSLGGPGVHNYAYTAAGGSISKVNNNTFTAYGAAYTTNDIIGVAVDLDNGAIYFSKNGVWQNSGVPTSGASRTGAAFTGLDGNQIYFPAVGYWGAFFVNFGQRAFAYTPPSGYNSLCANNLPTPAITRPSNHFDIRTYIGNGGGLQVGNVVKEASSYSIANSVRFNDDDSPSFLRTFTATGNRQRLTHSWWFKRQNLALSNPTMFCSADDNTSVGAAYRIFFDSSDRLQITNYESAYQIQLITNQVFRDTTAWYNLVVAIDTTQATASNRVRVYLNGAEITSWATATYPAQNTNLSLNFSGKAHTFGCYYNAPLASFTNFFDGYLAEFFFINDQYLTPTDFGQFDANNVWIPKSYAGTYGTTGFYLNFADTSAATAAAFGKDLSGNGNNWTPANLSVTAGANNDALFDSPTNNYCVLDPLNNPGGSTISNGGLNVTTVSSGFGRVAGTIPLSSGKWYFETLINDVGVGTVVGIIPSTDTTVNYPGQSLDGYGYYNVGTLFNNGTQFTYGASYTTNDVIGTALDLDNKTITFYKNNVSQGTVNIRDNRYLISVADAGTGTTTMTLNFGQRAFTYTPPTGFLAVNTDNMGLMGEVAGSPDLVWIKSRSGTTDWAVYDTTRGATIDLVTNLQNAETTQVNGIQKFDRNGFYIGNLAKINTLNATYVSYLWNESVAAGIDIITYTGTAANRTISHNLGVAPAMMMIKSRTAATNWTVYHRNMTLPLAAPGQNRANLETNAASNNDATVWNATAPTSSVFSLGIAGAVNNNANTFIAYLFAEVPGFSRFGSYIGNGSTDGPFVWCGFRPRWILIKRIDGLGHWYVYDTVRNTFNANVQEIYPSLTNAEGNSATGLDILANGFKHRTSTDTQVNANGGTYIFAAFAETPFKFSNAR